MKEKAKKHVYVPYLELFKLTSSPQKRIAETAWNAIVDVLGEKEAKEARMLYLSMVEDNKRFSVGQEVVAKGRKGHVYGKISRILRKNVEVRDYVGNVWRVDPSIVFPCFDLASLDPSVR